MRARAGERRKAPTSTDDPARPGPVYRLMTVTDTPPIPTFGKPTLKAQTPNILTAARLVMTAAFIAVLSVYRYNDSPTWILHAGIALFSLAAVTDFFDGFLARRWDAISVFGRVMDPLADKLLVLSGFILLAGPGFSAYVGPDGNADATQVTGIWPWMAAVILSRELLITSLRGVCEARGIDFSASMVGKLKMVAQSAGVPVILVLVAIADSTSPDSDLTSAIVATNAWIAIAIVVITVWSAVPYVTRAYRGLSAPPDEDTPEAGAHKHERGDQA